MPKKIRIDALGAYRVGGNFSILVIIFVFFMSKKFELERLKFCCHAEHNPASSFNILLGLFWIPAFAGMTSRINQHL